MTAFTWTALGWLALSSFLGFCCLAFSRYRGAAWAFYAALPMVLTPWWMFYYAHALFMWVKLYTMLAAAIYFLCIRFTHVGEQPWIARGTRWLMFMNIIEAVIQNLVSGVQQPKTAYLLNAAAGVVLMLSFPRGPIVRVEEGPHRRLLADVPYAWVVGYTLWNGLFVYLEWPDYIGIQCAIHLPALLYCLWQRQLWIQARAFSLAAYLMVHFSLGPYMDKLALEPTASEPLRLIWSVISLVWAVGTYINWEHPPQKSPRSQANDAKRSGPQSIVVG